MKRSRGLRADPEKVREWQRRTARPLARTAKAKPKVSDRSRRQALARSGGRCVCCGARAVQVHHVLPRQKWPEFIDEPANLVGVCVRCHERHELAVERIPRRALPAAAVELADAHGLGWYIERTYGSREEEAS